MKINIRNIYWVYEIMAAIEKICNFINQCHLFIDARYTIFSHEWNKQHNAVIFELFKDINGAL